MSNPEWQHQAEVVEKLIVELGANEIPRIDVFNKCDRVEAGDLRPHGADICSISARTGEGVDRLLEMIDRRLDKGTRRVTIHLPYDKGSLLDMLYREAKVESVEYSETIEDVYKRQELGSRPHFSGWTGIPPAHHAEGNGG